MTGSSDPNADTMHAMGILMGSSRESYVRYLINDAFLKLFSFIFNVQKSRNPRRLQVFGLRSSHHRDGQEMQDSGFVIRVDYECSCKLYY